LDHRAASRARCVWRVRFVSSSRSGYLQRAQFVAQRDCHVVELVIDNDRDGVRTEADGHRYDHEAGLARATAGLARATAFSCALRQLRRSERRISAWGRAARRGGSHYRDAGNHLHTRQGPLSGKPRPRRRQRQHSLREEVAGALPGPQFGNCCSGQAPRTRTMASFSGGVSHRWYFALIAICRAT